ncbi:MAG: undecaprenyl-diphosphate phosphatase [Nitrospinales bacterium]
MEYLNIIILAVIQGVTEFLPVSSSGHLILAPLVFNFPDQGLALDAILHLATLLAILIFFRADLWKLAVALFTPGGDPAMRRVAWSILLACFPAGIAGLLWGDVIEARFRNPNLVAVNMMVWSFVFLAADRRAGRQAKPIDRIEEISPGKILFVGLAQAFALVPGTSRSGVTLAAGLFGQLSQTTAARLSFLMGAPIILAAGLYKTAALLTASAPHAAFGLGPILVGFTVTFLLGYLSINLLFRIVSRAGLLPFIVYRILLSVLILFFYNV